MKGKRDAMPIEKPEFIYVNDINIAGLAATTDPEIPPPALQTELAPYARRILAPSETHEDGAWRLDEDGAIAPVLSLLESASEWNYFIGDVEVSPEAYEAGKQALPTTGQVHHDQANSIADRAALSTQGIEAWRTTNAVDCALVLCRGDREGADWFRKPAEDGTLPPHALSNEQYAEFSHDLRELIGDNETFIGFVMAEFVHDLGKSAAFIQQAEAAGIPVVGRDHDTILHDVVVLEDVCDRLLPTLAQIKEFSPRAYDTAVDILLIKTNYAQLLTGEAPARIMDELLDVDPKTRGLFFFKHRLDIAGALGHRQHAGSLTMDSETYQDMLDLEWAITTDELEDDSVVRNNAYIRRRGLRLGVDIEAQPPETQDEMYAYIRLTMQQRLHEPAALEKILHDAGKATEIVRRILATQLNRNGTDDKAILPGYGPAVLMAMSKDAQFADNYLTIYAMILHEASLYARAKGPNDTGITVADLKDIATAINKKSIDLGSAIRFSVKASNDAKAMIYPELHKPPLERLEGLGDFDGESLRGKRIMMVGMAGGADNLHAGNLGSFLAGKYGATLAGIMTFRKSDQILRGGQTFGASATFVNANSVPHGSWSRGNIEKALVEVLQVDDRPEVSISNADSHVKRKRDLQTFSQITDADIIIAVDPGGDSFSYLGDYADSAHLATKQDHQVIKALREYANEYNIPAHTISNSVGLYAKAYSLGLMQQAGSARLPLTDGDRRTIVETSDRLGMLHQEDARYSTTAMIFEKAAEHEFGLQSIDLPSTIVTSSQNPWRVFFEVTEAMGEVVITEINKHYAAIARTKPTTTQ